MTNQPGKKWPEGTVIFCTGWSNVKNPNHRFTGYIPGDLAVVDSFNCIRLVKNGGIYTGTLGTWEKFDEEVTEEDLLG